MRYKLYVDGSFVEGSATTKGAMVVLNQKDEPVIAQKYFIGVDAIVAMRNVGGELFSTVFGLLELLAILGTAESHSIRIYHDYKGISCLVTDEWKNVTKTGTALYRQKMKAIIAAYPNIDLSFQKVKSHSGDKWNDIVDRLASTSSVPSEIEHVLLKDKVI